MKITGTRAELEKWTTKEPEARNCKIRLNEREVKKKNLLFFETILTFFLSHSPEYLLFTFFYFAKIGESIIISVVLFWCSHSRRKWETIPPWVTWQHCSFIFFHLKFFFFFHSFLVWNHCSENYSRRFLSQ